MSSQTIPSDETQTTGQNTLSWRTLGLIFGATMLIAGVIIFTLLYIFLPQPQEPTVLEARNANGVREIDPARSVVDFTMPATTGERLSISDLQGKPTLIYFGYTHCPDVCLISLSDVILARRELGDLADEFNYVFVSVDGERDTPEILNRFFSQRRADFMIGMTGTDATLTPIKPDYGLSYELRFADADQNGNYPVDHTASLYLLDANGDLTTIFAYGTAPELMAERMRAEL